jgi:ElaB/YqjD/DUF883 family membrane-anchored ribosome-binding protein
MAYESILNRRTLVSATGEPLKSNPSTTEQSAQIAALKAEIGSLKESISVIATTTRSLAGTGVDVAVNDAEEILKRNVFASVGIAALIGYLWGRVGRRQTSS